MKKLMWGTKGEWARTIAHLEPAAAPEINTPTWRPCERDGNSPPTSPPPALPAAIHPLACRPTFRCSVVCFAYAQCSSCVFIFLSLTL